MIFASKFKFFFDQSLDFVLGFIKRVIDSLRMNKLNVLHWHLTEWQSWPYRSDIFPEISAAGAWSDSEQYTVSELRFLVEYAAKRGIRIMAELDQPGHMGALLKKILKNISGN